MTACIDQQRRALLLGRRQDAAKAPLRPPWALPEADFLARCTRCGECIDTCPEQIISKGDGGFPALDFHRGECTFCQACVEACTDGAFSDTAGQAPWNYRARITDDCLSRQQVDCRSCGESCEGGAIRFELQPRRVPQPRLSLEACTGCGACVPVCPASAIHVAPGPVQAEQER